MTDNFAERLKGVVLRASAFQSELDAAGLGRPAPEFPLALDMDLATAVARLLQIDRERKPDHFLWERVITCDVPRLMSFLTSEGLNALTESIGDHPSFAALQATADQYRTSWS